jgi:hypothetical protein
MYFVCEIYPHCATLSREMTIGEGMPRQARRDLAHPA